jgi:phosphoglycolate phosphatase
MTRLIIFDWDDVLTLGSKEGYFACYFEALKAVGVRMDEREARRRILAKWGSPHRIEIESLLREQPQLVDAACEAYRRHFARGTFLSQLRLPGDIPGLLERLRKSHTLAVATGQHPEFLKHTVIPTFNIPDVFSVIITAYDVPDRSFSKPHPWMIERILEITGIPRDEALMVGDARQDMEMARNAGVRAAAVLTGHLSRKEALEMGVDGILDTVLDLEEFLENQCA